MKRKAIVGNAVIKWGDKVTRKNGRKRTEKLFKIYMSPWRGVSLTGGGK